MKKVPNQHCNVKHRKVCLPSDKNLTSLAKLVTYVGSEHHKAWGNSFFKNLPQPRPDASLCDKGITKKKANSWLENGILKGNVYWLDSSDCYPRYVWYQDEDIVYEARLMDSKRGHYKGYPLRDDEPVRGLK